MAEMPGKGSGSFIYYSRSVQSDDTDTNEKLASVIRRSTALNYFEAIERGVDNKSICELLEAGLETYSKVVDDPKGVNNYANQVLELLPNTTIGNQSSWKSSLTSDKILSFINPLPCSKDKTDLRVKLDCANAGPSVCDLHSFNEARRSFAKKKADQPPPPPVFSSSIPPINKQSFRKPPVHLEEPKRNICTNKFAVSKKSDLENEIASRVFKKQGSYGSEPQRSVSSFKTANQELKIQNLKKYGKESGRGDNQYNYGAVKKSLGARKGGSVHGKFQPPILKDDGERDQPNKRTSYDENFEEELDERLKNIDPKMIEIIRNEIMDSGPKLTWEDIAGLDFAKNTIQEIVVWPMLRPDIFTGLRRPPKGILLFGPPGTGKTLIGKCIASQSGATFLSISASSLTSKWVGDGEKMVRALFAVARVDQPSVVFIDEIDSLLSQRSDTEHESSRRIKTEFLVQLDGCGTGEEDRILIIGATNRPQELDEAARRRLVKRLYIPLPDRNARAQMVKNLIANERHILSDKDVEEIALLTDGYSGADVKHVCQEASLGPIRSIPPMQISAITSNDVRPVNISDFKSALTRVKSTVSPDDLHSYVTWDKQFGCGSL